MRSTSLVSTVRIAAEIAGAAVLLVAAIGIGAFLREQRTEPQSPAAAPLAESLAAPTQRPQPNCAVLGQVTPVPVPPLATVDLANGKKSITSAEGGYTVIVPTAWLVQPGIIEGTAWFGQTRITSYDPKTLPRPGPEAPGILPPSFGISLDLQLWWNPKGEALDQFAQHMRIGPDQLAVLPGGVVSVGGKQAYRTTIQDQRQYQPATGPVITTRQTRIVWIVPTDRNDRVLVAYATPGESDLFPEVERIVGAIVLTTPASPTLPVIHQRDEILGRWLYDKSGAPIAGRRAEAKLLTYGETVAAFGGGTGLPRIDRDPDELFWLVAVTGPDLPQGRGGPGGTSPPTAWIMYEAPATNDRYEGAGTRFASAGTWPADFDALPDRCR